MKKGIVFILILAIICSACGVNTIAYADDRGVSEIASTQSQLRNSGIDVYFVLEGKEIVDDMRSADYNKMQLNVDEVNYIEYIFNDFSVEKECSYSIMLEQILRFYSEGETLAHGEIKEQRIIGSFGLKEVVVVQKEITHRDFEIDFSGVYNIKFSPTNIYHNSMNVLTQWMGDYIKQEAIFIDTEKEFVDFAKKSKNESFGKGKIVILTSDLDFAGMKFQSIEYFNGIFNGNGFKIKNIDIENSTSNVGVFRYIGNMGQVINLNVEIDIAYNEDSEFIGGIAGNNKGIIANCNVYGTINGKEHVGGIVGINSYSNVDEDGESYIYSGEVFACNNYATVTGSGNVGGIAGANKGSIQFSNNYGKINNSGHMPKGSENVVAVGGIAGFHSGIKIIGCGNFEVVGSEYMSFVGGITGSAFGDIAECENGGRVVGNEYVGGIVGHFADASNIKEYEKIEKIGGAYKLISMNGIVNNENPSSMTAEELLGTTNTVGMYPLNDIYNQKGIIYSLNQGKVFGTKNVGGIVGYVYGDDDYMIVVLTSINTGKINSKDGIAGGIVGNHSGGYLEQCFNTGGVSSENGDSIGGIAGVSRVLIKDCYSIARIAGESRVGGIVGSGHHVENCYSSGIVEATESYKGAIAGELSGTATFNYFLNDKVGGVDDVSKERSAVSLSVDEISSGNGKIPQKMTGFRNIVWECNKNEKGFPKLIVFYRTNGYIKVDGELDYVMRKLSESSTALNYKVKFVDEVGNEVETITVGAGEILESANLPKVPVKKGCFGSWGDFEIDENASLKIVKPEYIDSKKEVLATTESGIVVKIKGDFHPNTTLMIKENIFNEPHKVDGYKQQGILEIEMHLDGEVIDMEGVTTVVKMPEKVNSFKVGAVSGNEVVEFESDKTDDGLEFTHSGKLRVALFYSNGITMNFYLLLAIVAVVIIVVAVTLLRLKLRK